MKIWMINVTLQISMAATSVELAYTDEGKANECFLSLGVNWETKDQKPRLYAAKDRRAYIRGCDVACVTISEMQVQGSPMFQ